MEVIPYGRVVTHEPLKSITPLYSPLNLRGDEGGLGCGYEVRPAPYWVQGGHRRRETQPLFSI
jgi:hypothetical protein